MIPVVDVGPLAGCSVIVPGWVPTAACAAVEPSSDAPATSAPAPSSTAVRLSRFRRKIGIPFMEGFLSASLGGRRAGRRAVWRVSLTGRALEACPDAAGPGRLQDVLSSPARPGLVG